MPVSGHCGFHEWKSDKGDHLHSLLGTPSFFLPLLRTLRQAQAFWASETNGKIY